MTRSQWCVMTRFRNDGSYSKLISVRFETHCTCIHRIMIDRMSLSEPQHESVSSIHLICVALKSPMTGQLATLLWEQTWLKIRSSARQRGLRYIPSTVTSPYINLIVQQTSTHVSSSCPPRMIDCTWNWSLTYNITLPPLRFITTNSNTDVARNDGRTIYIYGEYVSVTTVILGHNSCTIKLNSDI